MHLTKVFSTILVIWLVSSLMGYTLISPTLKKDFSLNNVHPEVRGIIEGLRTSRIFRIIFCLVLGPVLPGLYILWSLGFKNE